jgi:hypothetical protein
MANESPKEILEKVKLTITSLFMKKEESKQHG